jgi:hypothetical protein
MTFFIRRSYAFTHCASRSVLGCAGLAKGVPITDLTSSRDQVTRTQMVAATKGSAWRLWLQDRRLHVRPCGPYPPKALFNLPFAADNHYSSVEMPPTDIEGAIPRCRKSHCSPRLEADAACMWWETPGIMPRCRHLSRVVTTTTGRQPRTT